jgi:cyclic 2,3-diphosphoglycerate synthetase
VGGEEKLAPEALADPRKSFGREAVLGGSDPAGALRRIAGESGAEAVFDLSGEPVLDPPRRDQLAAVALANGLGYRAPGVTLTPPAQEEVDADVPIVAVIGTGKRSGKTAVAGHLASLLAERAVEPVIVSMGRGGPAEPELVRAGERPDAARLLELARAGAHAASDYLEDATLAGVATVGCRRCGEGPAGEVFDSNVAAGVRLALSLEPDAVVLEGSGASLPPVASDRTVCVVRATDADRAALSDLGPLRLMRSDLVLLLGADAIPLAEVERLAAALARWSGEAPVIPAVLAAEAGGSVAAGARVAVFTTAPPAAEAAIRNRLEALGLEVSAYSGSLSRRAQLARDVERAAEQGCDVFLTELKAAAIDVVAEAADRLGVALEFLRHRPVSLYGDVDLDASLWSVFEQARSARAEAVQAAAP